MKNDYSLTLGITTWNSERTLDALVHSAELMGVMTNIKLKIIIADDGSTDSTEEHVNSLIKTYNNITFIKNEHTGFPSLGRSSIIKIADTDFIAFADSDDLILDCAHKECMEYLYKSDLNTAAFRVLCAGPNSAYIRKFTNSDEPEIVENEDIFKLKRFTCVWNKVWKTDFVKQFEFENCSGEDRLFCFMTYSKDFRVAILPCVGYVHYFRKGIEKSLGQRLGDKEVKKENDKIYIQKLKAGIEKYNVKENKILHKILLDDISRFEANL